MKHNDNKVALIAANGDNFRNYLQEIKHQYDFVIAADGGANSLLAMDFIPSMIIGDLDSIDEKTMLRCQELGIELCQLNPQKDYTDTHVAIEKAFERGYQEIHLAGGMGGRWDHSIGNLNLLFYGYQKGITIKMISPKNEAEIIGVGEHHFSKRENYYWSFVAIFEDAMISIEGMKYNLVDQLVLRGDSIGLSNEYICDGKICIKKGSVLVIQSQMDK